MPTLNLNVAKKSGSEGLCEGLEVLTDDGIVTHIEAWATGGRTSTPRQGATNGLAGRRCPICSWVRSPASKPAVLDSLSMLTSTGSRRASRTEVWQRIASISLSSDN